MLGTVFTPASGSQPASRVSVVIESQDDNGLADDVSVARSSNAGLQRALENAADLVVAGGPGRDLVYERIERNGLPGAWIVLVSSHASSAFPESDSVPARGKSRREERICGHVGTSLHYRRGATAICRCRR